MSDSPLLQHPRHRFVAFSAVGVAMVCLPLWQVLRYQQSDLHQLAAERALLDPVSQAVQVQFGLLAHRQVAGQLLQGQAQLEPARLAVQVGVDEQLRSLAQQLAQGLWSHALAETRDLTRDWQALAHQVKTRALNAPLSDESHTLRVEQAVQVVDLVTLADAVSDSGATTRSPDSLRFAHLARQLSKLAADGPWLGAHTANTDGTTAATTAAITAATHLETAQRRLQRFLQSLEAARPPAAEAALAEVGRTARLVLQLQADQSGQPSSPDGPTPLHSAQLQAQQAQLALFNQALGQHKRVLAQRQHQVQRQQGAVLATWALLGAVALALAAGGGRPPRPRPAPGPPSPAKRPKGGQKRGGTP